MKRYGRGNAKKMFVVAFGLIVAATGCGSGATTSSSAATASSISDLPAVSTLVKTSSSSSDVSAPLMSEEIKAVSGTPPLLKNISESNVDTYFWNGLLATIASAKSATPAQDISFWNGEGACRMAETVGYAFQNLLQAGTSLCYMQNVPNSANGVAIVSGNASSVSDIFKQGSSDKIVKVKVTNMSKSQKDSSSPSDEIIFIKVFKGSDFAADLWFCPLSTPTGYEQIRISSGTFTSTDVESSFGNFVGIISASLTTDANGKFVFDSSKSRSGQVYFGPSDKSFTFLGSVAIDSAGLLTARNYQTGSFGGGPT